MDEAVTQETQDAKSVADAPRDGREGQLWTGT